MTAIQQSSIPSHHTIDDTGQHSGNSGGGAEHDKKTMDNSAGVLNSSTVNISFQATMRLQAYQEQRALLSTSQELKQESHQLRDGQLFVEGNNPSDLNPSMESDRTSESAIEAQNVSNSASLKTVFPQKIESMLNEVQDNLVQSNEPGYRHLVNLLQNHQDRIEDNQQLEDIMRKEQFYLGRRKAFMSHNDFQSYSQVLNQFTHIVERQQYAFS